MLLGAYLDCNDEIVAASCAEELLVATEVLAFGLKIFTVALN